METTHSFGYWVRRQRKALDLTQRELAGQVGCALVTIKKIESDQRRPSDLMAERLADSLSVGSSDRAAFLEAARGERPVDRLKLAGQPLVQKPLDHIPRPATPLIGRETEIAAVRDLLNRPETWLVTIVGPGGMGKTRLALAVATALSEMEPRPFSWGIRFVDLAPLSSSEQLISAIAKAAGFEPTGRDRQPLATQLIEFLRGKDQLLLLDNFENVHDGALWLKELLPLAPQLKLLVTSRERLNLAGEQLVPLAGLPYAEAPVADPTPYPAAQLFLERARTLQPGYSIQGVEAGQLDQICRLVEGMPLALELTAAWVDTLSLAGIVANLQESLALFESDLLDLPQRHRSLRSVWGTTWQRMPAEEQELFARLSLFRGGFTKEAGSAVAGVTLPLLARLTGKYLVTLAREEGRYTIHELLRQYGEEQLEEAGQLAGGRQHHFDYYLQLAETAEINLHGPEQAAWLDRLDAEQDNLRLALEWGLQRPENAGSFARLIYSVSWHWRIRSHFVEGSSWLVRALDRADWPAVAQAQLLYVAGHMAWMHGEFAAAGQHYTASLALWQEIDGATGRVANLTRHGLGMTAQMQEETAGALSWFLESLAGFQALDDEWGIAFTQGWLATVCYALGDQEAADVAIEESLEISRRLGDNWLLGLFIAHSAYMAWEAGDLARALPLAEEARELGLASGHTHSLSQMLVMLGQIAARQGEPEKAHRYYSEALTMFEEMGHQSYAAEVEALLADVS